MATVDPDFLTVGQLIELLSKEPTDAIVAMYADGSSGYVEQVLPAAEDPIVQDGVMSVTLNDYFSKRPR